MAQHTPHTPSRGGVRPREGARDRFERGQRGAGGPSRRDEGRHDRSVTLDRSRIRFAKVEAELFNEIADSAAQTIAKCGDRQNKPSQIRRFYDELCLWEDKVRAAPQEFSNVLPFVKMLNAKAAYANGRGLVDNNFNALIEHCVKQVTTYQELKTFKVFFEAFLGFLKRHKPKEG